jgi:hypothetical protein
MTKRSVASKLLPPSGRASIQHLPIRTPDSIERFLMAATVTECAKIEKVEVRCPDLHYVLARLVKEACETPGDSFWRCNACIGCQDTVMHGELRGQLTSAPSVGVNAICL